MDNAFASIDLLSLETVTGGADSGKDESGPNRTGGSFNIGATVRGTQIGIQGEGHVNKTDYATCVSETRAAGGGPADIRQTCGLPGGR